MKNSVTRRRMHPGVSLVLVFAGLVAGPAWSESISYPVLPGDVLQVSVYAGGTKVEEFTATVSGSGSMAVPLLGDLAVTGQTPEEIAEHLRGVLSQGYYVDPKVIVGVKEYAGKIYIIGAVQHPGAYPFQGGLTVLNACVMSGGLTPFAAAGRVKVTRTRDGVARLLDVDLGKVRKGKQQDLSLEPGDRIEVPTRRF